MTYRPNIPADLKRRILMEAGYRCAIPTCRDPETEIVHIDPYSKVKEHRYENLIALCPTCHSRFDKKRIPRKAMVAYKKKLIFLNDVYSRFELDVLDYLKTNKRAVIPGELLIKRLFDEKLVQREEEIMIHGFFNGDTVLGVFSVVLTDKGKQLLDDWGKIDDSLTYDGI